MVTAVSSRSPAAGSSPAEGTAPPAAAAAAAPVALQSQQGLHSALCSTRHPAQEN